MDETAAFFVATMTAMVLVALLILISIRTRSQVKIANGGLEASRQLELLSGENAGLKGQIGRLEERIAVLERLAVDPAERTAREIDSLR